MNPQRVYVIECNVGPDRWNAYEVYLTPNVAADRLVQHFNPISKGGFRIATYTPEVAA